MKNSISWRRMFWFAVAGWLTVCSGAVSAQTLLWDSRVKEFNAAAGEINVHFTFSVTNISAGRIIIMDVKPSCGCTAVKWPARPWTMQPGDGGLLEVEVDLRGKSGLLAKSILVETSVGPQVLLTKVNIGAEAGGTMTRARNNNMLIAQANRQLVFRGDCARCHVVPAFQKTGRLLYLAACGICHEAENRASMVPDLRNPKHPTDRDYWRTWITHGKAGSLMPAFAESEGGPLNEKQIQSLVDLLEKEVPTLNHSSGK